MREYGSANVIHTSQHNQMVPAHRNTNVPIILDVTDELNNSAKTAQQSTNHAFYNPQYPQQSFYSQVKKFIEIVLVTYVPACWLVHSFRRHRHNNSN